MSRSSFRRAALAGACSLALLGAGIGLSAAPASAAHVPHAAQAGSQASDADSHGCGSHTWCMYTLPGYMGVQYSYNYNDNPHNTWLYVGNAANDAAVAIDNNRAWITSVAKNSPANAQWACDEGAVSDLSGYSWPNGTTADHSISAIFFTTGGSQLCGETWP